ncbi:MAG: tail fiber domain-containing protein [Flavobacteriaceae bacterium]
MMKKVAYILLLISTISFSQVGIGTTSPDPSSALDITSTHTGILIPRMTEAQRTGISSPATGLLVYQTNNVSGFWYYNSSSWVNIPTSAGSGEFQSISGVVQNTTNLVTDDFVFGDTNLSGSGSKFFFDKSKGAFRAGQAFGTEWDDINVGIASIALGASATASGDYSLAGQGGIASGNTSISIGANTQADSDGSIALGDGSMVAASSDYGMSLGFGNSVSAAYGTAIGYENEASGERSFAFGSNAIASGIAATAFSDATASGTGSFAGITAIASGVNAIALQGGNASAISSISIGPNTQAASDGAIAIGDGSTVATSSNYGMSLGFGNSVSAAYGTAIGYENEASGERSFAFGSNAIASGIAATAFSDATASGNGSFAGISGTASGINSIALAGGTASGNYSISLGPDTVASGEGAIAIGNEIQALSFQETAFGFNSLLYTPTSTTSSNANDRLFVVGNGDATLSIPSTNNAFTILKDGRTGIMRIPTTNILEVEGQASKSTAGDWLANSDARLKKNITSFSEDKALEKLLQMRGVIYEWNDDKTGSKRPEGIQYGFIAQEIMEVFPENVEMDNLGYYQTAYGTYDALYVQSIKALHTKMETLEIQNLQLLKDNELLKSKILKLEALEQRLEALEILQN